MDWVLQSLLGACPDKQWSKTLSLTAFCLAPLPGRVWILAGEWKKIANNAEGNRLWFLVGTLVFSTTYNLSWLCLNMTDTIIGIPDSVPPCSPSRGFLRRDEKSLWKMWPSVVVCSSVFSLVIKYLQTCKYGYCRVVYTLKLIGMSTQTIEINHSQDKMIPAPVIVNSGLKETGASIMT